MPGSRSITPRLTRLPTMNGREYTMKANIAVALLAAGLLAACGRGAEDGSAGMMDSGAAMMEDSTQMSGAMESGTMEHPAMDNGSMTHDSSAMRRP